MTKLSLYKFGGYFVCKSATVGTIYSTCDSFSFDFFPGVYILRGEIDSGAWAVASSLIKHKNTKQNVYDLESKVVYNNMYIPQNYICNIAHSLDQRNVTHITVKQQIKKNIKKNKLSISLDKFQEIFQIDNQRFSRTIRCVGNEIYNCNAAIGYAEKKEVFSFPWISLKKYNYLCNRIHFLCETLDKLGCIVLLPVSASVPLSEFNNRGYDVLDF